MIKFSNKLITSVIKQKNNFGDDDEISNITVDVTIDNSTLVIKYVVWGEFAMKEIWEVNDFTKASRNIEIDNILK